MPRPARNVDRDAVRRLHAEGLVDWEIAAQLGVSKMTVCHVRHELGLASNGKRGKIPMRQFGQNVGGAEYGDEEAEVLRAADDYRRKHRLRFMGVCDMLKLLKELGYARATQ